MSPPVNELARRLGTYSPNVPTCLLLTLIAVGLATAIRVLLGTFSGVTIIYPTYYLAVLLVGLTCGARWGVLSVLLSIVAVHYVLLSPEFTFNVPTSGSLLNSALFALVSLCIVWIAHTQRALIHRLNYKREMLALLMKELQHRSKNHLSVVQAIVAHSLRGESQRAREIAGRIKCLAEADDLLTKSPQQNVDLAELAELELGPFKPAIRTQGPSVMLGPTLAQVFALVLHELSTNATKYGALSKDGGQVAVTWSAKDDSLHLSWIETGGPAVTTPRKGGFGLSFLNTLLKSVNGQITTGFRPEGIVHDVVTPLQFLEPARSATPLPHSRVTFTATSSAATAGS